MSYSIVRAGLIAIALISLPALSNAAGISDFAGKWSEDNFIFECKEGGIYGLSCIILEGPKNKGAEIVMSKAEFKDGALTAGFKDPVTEAVVKSKGVVTGDTWAYEDCDPAGSCTRGELKRVK